MYSLALSCIVYIFHSSCHIVLSENVLGCFVECLSVKPCEEISVRKNLAEVCVFEYEKHNQGRKNKSVVFSYHYRRNTWKPNSVTRSTGQSSNLGTRSFYGESQNAVENNGKYDLLEYVLADKWPLYDQGETTYSVTQFQTQVKSSVPTPSNTITGKAERHSPLPPTNISDGKTTNPTSTTTTPDITASTTAMTSRTTTTTSTMPPKRISAAGPTISTATNTLTVHASSITVNTSTTPLSMASIMSSTTPTSTTMNKASFTATYITMIRSAVTTSTPTARSTSTMASTVTTPAVRTTSTDSTSTPSTTIPTTTTVPTTTSTVTATTSATTVPTETTTAPNPTTAVPTTTTVPTATTVPTPTTTVPTTTTTTAAAVSTSTSTPTTTTTVPTKTTEPTNTVPMTTTTTAAAATTTTTTTAATTTATTTTTVPRTTTIPTTTTVPTTQPTTTAPTTTTTATTTTTVPTTTVEPTTTSTVPNTTVPTPTATITTTTTTTTVPTTTIAPTTTTTVPTTTTTSTTTTTTIAPTTANTTTDPHCIPSSNEGNFQCTENPDCFTLKTRNPRLSSGLYTINPDGTEAFQVFCDMETAGGGWTVIQRRMDGMENFDQNLAFYEHGFGDLRKEFWLGNKKIHRLVNWRASELRFDLEDFSNQTRYAVYRPVSVADKSDGYRISLGKYYGTAGDSFRDSNDYRFTAKDYDVDGKWFENCAKTCKGAWWYSVCHGVNVNGEYNNREGAGISWKDWHGPFYSLKFTEMKIRPSSPGWKDCVGLMNEGKRSGVYTMNPDGRQPFRAFCNMYVDGGGWMVVQRRVDGSENFFRPWADYVKGFGDPNREYWLGHDNLHLVTKDRKYTLRFDMEDFEGNKRYAVYRDFQVWSYYYHFQLSVGKYCGDAVTNLPNFPLKSSKISDACQHHGIKWSDGDSFTYQNTQYFSTKDIDHDSWSGKNCARDYRGAWWYNSCHECNPNGEYNNSVYGQGITWKSFRGDCYSLKFIEMKIRPQ